MGNSHSTGKPPYEESVELTRHCVGKFMVLECFSPKAPAPKVENVEVTIDNTGRVFQFHELHTCCNRYSPSAKPFGKDYVWRPIAIATTYEVYPTGGQTCVDEGKKIHHFHTSGAETFSCWTELLPVDDNDTFPSSVKEQDRKSIGPGMFLPTSAEYHGPLHGSNIPLSNRCKGYYHRALPSSDPQPPRETTTVDSSNNRPYSSSSNRSAQESTRVSDVGSEAPLVGESSGGGSGGSSGTRPHDSASKSHRVPSSGSSRSRMKAGWSKVMSTVSDRKGPK